MKSIKMPQLAQEVLNHIPNASGEGRISFSEGSFKVTCNNDEASLRKLAARLDKRVQLGTRQRRDATVGPARWWIIPKSDPKALLSL